MRAQSLEDRCIDGEESEKDELDEQACRQVEQEIADEQFARELAEVIRADKARIAKYFPECAA